MTTRSDVQADVLQLFGAPRIRFWSNGCSVAVEWAKGAAFLAYLACHPEWHQRASLAAMLRPHDEAAGARSYLRRLLHRIRHLHPALTGLEIEDERIRWCGTSDVQQFEEAFASRQWEQALRVQASPLLDTAASAGLPALDDWVWEQRNRLRQNLRSALIALITERKQLHQDCTKLMQRLLDEDPTDEESVQFVLANARTPLEHHTAASAFDTFQRRLQAEWGLRPLAETVERHQRLRGARPAAAIAVDSIPTAPFPPPLAAPLGREAVLQELWELVQDPRAKLLTIHGFGGVGKTVLARALHQALVPSMPGCVWVDLLAVATPHAMLDAIAACSGMPPPEDSVEDHLVRWLSGRPWVIFLDNFEQLIPHAAALARLIDAAPQARFVVTSRQALRLAHERAILLEGLDWAGDDSASVRLFSTLAARAGYQAGEADASAIEAIVEHLQGLPLAIELAARWTTLLTPSALLAELRADSAFLDGSSRATLGSTRSMRSVLEGAWQRLSGKERDALAGLAVFAGTLGLDQARSVAAAAAPLLLQLVDKSLLQRVGQAGFRLHPLLRDFALANGDPGVIDTARQRHARHYLGQLAASPSVHFGCARSAGVQSLLVQVADILNGWRWAVENRDFPLLHSALPKLGMLLLVSGRHEEAVRLCAHATSILPFEPLGPEIAAVHAAACFEAGRMREARGAAESALQHGMTGMTRAWLEATLARLDWFESDYASSSEHAQRALQAASADDPCFRSLVLQDSANARYGLGQIEAGLQDLRQSLELARTHQAAYLEGRALCFLGVFLSATRQPAEALQSLESASAIFESLGLAYDAGFALRCRSYACFVQGSRQSQVEAAQAALAKFREGGYEHEIGESLFALGLAHFVNGAIGQAMACLSDALSRCLHASNVSGALRCIALLGVMHLQQDRAWGVALACFAFAHPGLRQPDRHELQGMLARFRVRDDELAQGEREAQGWTLEDVCGRLLARLASMAAPPEPPGATPAPEEEPSVSAH